LLNVTLGLGLGYGDAFLQGVGVVWWAILYAGVLSIGLGFTLQVVGQRRAPAADAAVIMSLEAVFATLFGWLLLGETLNPQQILGCGLMVAGMLLAQVRGAVRAEASYADVL
jgi:drug/metabolite transporter (DMT)-like permease